MVRTASLVGQGVFLTISTIGLTLVLPVPAERLLHERSYYGSVDPLPLHAVHRDTTPANSTDECYANSADECYNDLDMHNDMQNSLQTVLNLPLIRVVGGAGNPKQPTDHPDWSSSKQGESKRPLSTERPAEVDAGARPGRASAPSLGRALRGLLLACAVSASGMYAPDPAVVSGFDEGTTQGLSPTATVRTRAQGSGSAPAHEEGGLVIGADGQKREGDALPTGETGALVLSPVQPTEKGRKGSVAPTSPTVGTTEMPTSPTVECGESDGEDQSPARWSTLAEVFQTLGRFEPLSQDSDCVVYWNPSATSALESSRGMSVIADINLDSPYCMPSEWGSEGTRTQNGTACIVYWETGRGQLACRSPLSYFNNLLIGHKNVSCQGFQEFLDLEEVASACRGCTTWPADYEKLSDALKLFPEMTEQDREALFESEQLEERISRIHLALRESYAEQAASGQFPDSGR